MTSFDVDDTIVAIASAPGPGLRGIVRLSGPQMAACLQPLFLPSDDQPLASYRSPASLSGVFQVTSGATVPGQLLLWPTRRSYTRQPTAEIHTVGSPPILQAVVKSICEQGARLARPGEFTLRAFLSGRIDLTQAEAVLAVIDADGQQQLSTALRQLAGGLAGPLGDVRNHLLSLLAELEAGLDFVEEDIEFISQQELESQLTLAQQQLANISNQIISRDMTFEATKVVLLGLPNSGKSSLFNALSQSQDAIVTDVAGTTTDFISSHLTIDSQLVELIDTAGFESLGAEVPDAAIMDQAQSHRIQQQNQSSLRLLCIDGSRDMTPWESDQLAHADPSTLVALTKSDLTHAPQSIERPSTNASSPALENIRSRGFAGPVIPTSVHDAGSLDTLRAAISTILSTLGETEQSVVNSTVLRAAESLHDAQRSVRRALDATRRQLGEEIVAAEVRLALEGLGLVVGTVYTDDILDLVFGRFCIGK